MSTENKKKLRRKIHIFLGIFVLIVLFIAGGSFALAQTAHTQYAGNLLPGTTIGGIDVSGKTYADAAVILNSTFDAYVNTGFTFTSVKNSVHLNGTDFGLNDPDASNDLVSLNTDASIAQAFANGHSGNIMKDGAALLQGYLTKVNYPLMTIVDKTGVESALHAKLVSIETPTTEPHLIWKDTGFTVKPGTEGSVFDTTSAINALQKQFANLQNVSIDIRTQLAVPRVTDAEARALATSANDVVLRSGLTLTGNNQSFSVATSTRASWISVRKENGKTILGVDPDVLGNFVNSIASMVEIAPQDSKFQVTDGRVVAFQNSHDGVKIDADQLRSVLESAWIQNHGSLIAIPTMAEKPNITNSDASNIGIKEVLGVGTSTYTGSTTARIKNLKNALKKLNGILIKPGEEFSLIKALEPFTAAGGWFPEKVIKGDQIKTEIGGGACQIGTTTFRATMNSGLPVTERQNHSLVVHYYNDPKNGNPGTDATIYDPKPDYKFLNDTGNYILFVAEINEKKLLLTFTFWGTSDGRVGSYTAPLVSKWYPPAATKIQTRTTDLPPGKSECQNSFKGADASFTYTVTKADGTKTDRVFTSHYRALPVVCMVGATKEDIAAYGSAILPGQVSSATVSTSTPSQAGTIGTPAAQ